VRLVDRLASYYRFLSLLTSQRSGKGDGLIYSSSILFLYSDGRRGVWDEEGQNANLGEEER
jgi:hypothetical protein